MARTLTFPGLGWEFHIAREAFSIGPITVYWYGIIVVTGIALGLWYGMRRSREFGIHPDRLMDVALYSVVAGLIGARIYYVAFSWEYYRVHPEEIIRIWEGGIALYGGVIGAFLMGYFLCRRWKMPPAAVADCAVGGLILGQAIGRWGNFVNIEAFGANTTLPWGMGGPVIASYLENHQAALSAMGILADPSMPVHPTFFYESMWNLAGFLFLVWYTKHRRFNGELTLFYAGWYGLGRVWIEGLRTDSLMLGHWRISQVLAGVGVILSVLAWVWLRRRVRAGTVPAALRLLDEQERVAQIRSQEPRKKEVPIADETKDESVSEKETDVPTEETETEGERASETEEEKNDGNVD